MIDWIVTHPWRTGLYAAGALAVVSLYAIEGWRLATRILVHTVLFVQLIYLPITIANIFWEEPWPWAAANLSVAAAWFSRTPLGALNFVVLQWFGVRLEVSQWIPGASIAEIRMRAKRDRGRWWSSEALRGADVQASWKLARWIWPLTGWWSAYRWIARRS